MESSSSAKADGKVQNVLSHESQASKMMNSTGITVESSEMKNMHANLSIQKQTSSMVASTANASGANGSRLSM